MASPKDKKSRFEAAGRFGIVKHALEKGVWHCGGEACSDSTFLKNFARLIEKWFENSGVADRLCGIARDVDHMNRARKISSCLVFRDREAVDSKILEKLKRYLKGSDQFDEVLNYRLTIMMRKIREYDNKAEKDWDLKYGPKPSHRQNSGVTNSSMADNILPVHMDSRLDQDTRAAGIGFDPECEMSKKIKREVADDKIS